MVILIFSFRFVLLSFHTHLGVQMQRTYTLNEKRMRKCNDETLVGRWIDWFKYAKWLPTPNQNRRLRSTLISFSFSFSFSLISMVLNGNVFSDVTVHIQCTKMHINFSHHIGCAVCTSFEPASLTGVHRWYFAFSFFFCFCIFPRILHEFLNQELDEHGLSRRNTIIT